MAKTNLDENRVCRFLRSHELMPVRYPKIRGRSKTKAPDFQVSGPNDVFFLCEVKSVLTSTGPDGILHSTIFNGLTEDVHEAVKQFRSVNSTHSVPNVLAWVSHNFQINVHSFLDLINGRITIERLLVADLTKFRHGRLAKEINDIDLHVWLESDDTPQYVFNSGHPPLSRQLRRAFGK